MNKEEGIIIIIEEEKRKHHYQQSTWLDRSSTYYYTPPLLSQSHIPYFTIYHHIYYYYAFNKKAFNTCMQAVHLLFFRPARRGKKSTLEAEVKVMCFFSFLLLVIAYTTYVFPALFFFYTFFPRHGIQRYSRMYKMEYLLSILTTANFSYMLLLWAQEWANKAYSLSTKRYAATVIY